MKRVMILGQPGSGKSTLARQIGSATGLPVVHVDHIHWMSGWVERPKDEKIAMALAEQAKPEWVFEGGLSATKEDRLRRADTLIVIELPYALRMWRVIKRTVRHYGRTRPDLPDGCPEQVSLEFWRWIWNTRHTAREANRNWAAKARELGKAVFFLASRKEVHAFVQGLGSAARSKQ
ncbi:MAG: AAA family ATPase [Pseudomonadota bacterium]